MSDHTQWQHRLNTHDAIDKYDGTNFQECKDGILSELRQHEELFKRSKVLKKLEAAQDAETLNRALDALYEYCDQHRIWLGGPPEAAEPASS